MDDLDALLNDLQFEIPAKSEQKSAEDALLDQLTSIPDVLQAPRQAKRLDKLASRLPAGPKQTLAADGPKKICESCREPIIRGGAILEGKYFHSEHFVCNVCKKSLKNVETFDRDDKLWCERDYHLTYSPQCGFCHEPIKENAVEALGQSFHPEHFFCAQCGMNLAQETFMECQGKPFCAEDYATIFASRCVHCLKPLLEDYVSALDKSYHVKCFTCSVNSIN